MPHEVLKSHSLRFRVWGVGFGILGLGVQGLGFRVWGLEFKLGTLLSIYGSSRL